MMNNPIYIRCIFFFFEALEKIDVLNSELIVGVIVDPTRIKTTSGIYFISTIHEREIINKLENVYYKLSSFKDGLDMHINLLQNMNKYSKKN